MKSELVIDTAKFSKDIEYAYSVLWILATLIEGNDLVDNVALTYDLVCDNECIPKH